MSVDTMRNPTAVAGIPLVWYRPTETTPFALAGHIGPVLASLTPDRYGLGSREVWFGDDGWAMPDGEPIDDADVRWFALMPPTPDDQPAADDDDGGPPGDFGARGHGAAAAAIPRQADAPPAQLDIVERMRGRREFISTDAVRWYLSSNPDGDCAAAAAEIARLRDAVAKAERRAIIFGDIVSNHCIAMQAAAIDGWLQSPNHGIKWIVNTLLGPGLLPDVDAARRMGGAQAWFDAKTAEHEAFRSAHPGPGGTGVVARLDALLTTDPT